MRNSWHGFGGIVSLLVCLMAWHGQVAGQVTGAALGALPATFAGDLPCADCPGIRHQLELHPDRVFYLRMTYQGKGADAYSDDIGSWTIARDRRTLMLVGRRESPLRFAIEDADTLRLLDREGRAIASPQALSHELKRSGDLPPLEPRLPMRGMYTYMADAGRFTECLTRRTWPVAMEQDNAALESAYSRARHPPGEPLLASVDGRVAIRPRMEGAGWQPALVVERFVGIWPGETCGARFATETLENTYWKLTRLGDAAVNVVPRQREAHLVLDPESRRVRGSTGCNRLTGSYQLSGDTLTFGPMAGTKMACVEGMGTERLFLDGLQQVKRWKMAGQHLELSDAEGRPVARFEARPLK